MPMPVGPKERSALPRETIFLSLSISWRLNLRNMIGSATFNIELIGSAVHPWNEPVIAYISGL